MKPMKHIASAVAVLLLAGCSTTFRPWMLSEIEEGMDRSEVIELLGQPDSAEITDGALLLHYSYSENYNPPLADDPFHVTSSRSRQSEREQIRRRHKEYRYIVKLVDGKVQNYKEVRD